MLPETTQLRFIDSFDEAAAFWRWLGERGQEEHVAIDTETTGLVIGTDTVRLAQVGGPERGWAMPWQDWAGLFKDFVKKYPGRIDMHNAKFDAGMLQHMGCVISRPMIDDTRVMAHIIEPHMPGALKKQAERHIDAQAANAQGDINKVFRTSGYDWDTVPLDLPIYWQYAALDTVLTWHLSEHYKKQIMAMAPNAYDIEMAVTWVIEKMERHGAMVDLAYAHASYSQFIRYCSNVEAWCLDNFGINPGSNQQVINKLVELGYTFDKKTASGAFALDKEVIGDIDHPLARSVLARRQRQKLASTYLLHFIQERDADGYIHPSINTLGARTSRMSMERPNLQNLPRKSEKNPDAEVIRNCIVSSSSDHTLVMCDFEQVEMRLLAHLSGDDGLIAAFHSDQDFFVELARSIYQDPNLLKSDPRRSVTKNVGYAKIYGAGVAKMAQTAGVPVDQVRIVDDRFRTMYPKVDEWKRGLERLAQQHLITDGSAYANSPLTNRRHVADAGKIYALANYFIQGTAAELLKMKLIQLDHAGLDEFMVVPVHDEIILDVPDDQINDVVKTLRSVMNDNEMFDVPIRASVSAGKRWGGKEDL